MKEPDSMPNLIIDPEFKQLIPPLQPNELAALEQSLIRNGCRDALVIWAGHNILLDGHCRYQICQEHNIPFGTIEMVFSSRQEAMAWVIQNQFARRNLNAYQRSELALKLEAMFARKAKGNQRLSLGRGIKGLQNSTNLNPVDTREEIAKVAGVSHDTIARVRKINARASPGLKAKLVAGSLSINEGYKAVKSEEGLGKGRSQLERGEPRRELINAAQILTCPACNKRLGISHYGKNKHRIVDRMEGWVVTIREGKDNAWVIAAFHHGVPPLEKLVEASLDQALVMLLPAIAEFEQKWKEHPHEPATEYKPETASNKKGRIITVKETESREWLILASWNGMNPQKKAVEGSLEQAVAMIPQAIAQFEEEWKGNPNQQLAPGGSGP